MDYLTEYRGHDLTIEDKLTFLRETRHAFGRTALVLSGGGALGAFHVVCRPPCIFAVDNAETRKDSEFTTLGEVQLLRLNCKADQFLHFGGHSVE